MERIDYIPMVSKTLINHLELRKSEIRSYEKKFIWVKFSKKAFHEDIMSKEKWHEQITATAISCDCKFVNLLSTDEDTQLMYFFTNPSYVEKTAMEKLQEASYAR